MGSALGLVSDGLMVEFNDVVLGRRNRENQRSHHVRDVRFSADGHDLDLLV